VLAQVVYAGAHAPSFARAAQDLRHLAGQAVAVKQVERLSRQVGAERVAERTAEVDAWRGRPLIDKPPLPGCKSGRRRCPMPLPAARRDRVGPATGARTRSAAS
jgi:hypothetical protein